MIKLLLVAGLVLGLSGCSKDKFDEVLGEIEGFRNEMCACKDKACSDQVQEKWRTYRKTMREKLGKDAKASQAQERKARVLDDEMRACRRKLDPDAAPSPTGEAPLVEAPLPATR